MEKFVTKKHTFVICSVLRNTPKKPHHGDTIGNLCTLARYDKNSIIYCMQSVSDRDGMARVPPVGERCPGIPITDTTPCSVEEFHMEVMAEMAEMRADKLELYAKKRNGSVLLKLKEYEDDKTKRVWKLTEDTEDEVFEIQQQQTERGVICTRPINEALEKGDIEEEKIGAAFEAMSTLLKSMTDCSNVEGLPKWWDAIHEAWTKGKWEEVKNKCEEVKNKWEEVKNKWQGVQDEHDKHVCDSLIDPGDSVDNQGVQTWPDQRLKSGISKPPHKGGKQPPPKPLSAMPIDKRS